MIYKTLHRKIAQHEPHWKRDWTHMDIAPQYSTNGSYIIYNVCLFILSIC